MARKNRSQFSIQERTANKRKQEDALLASGTFDDVGEIAADMISYEEEVVEETHPRKRRSSSWDDEEQDYELKPRVLQNPEEDMVEGLPIKINGKVERNLLKRQKKKHEIEEEEEESEEEVKEGEPKEGTKAVAEAEEEPDTEEKILQLQEEIAEMVENIMEDPEENTRYLTRLVKMVQSKNPNTCKFSILALVPVFNSIMPGYRIRPLSDIEKKEKVSKEVSRLRHFEQNLVVNYRNYIERLNVLSKVANNADPIKVSLGVNAMQAANGIISNASHFNFRTEVFSILIRRICKPNLRVDPIALTIINTVESLFTGDDEGSISVEIVRIFSKVLKIRNYMIDESTMNILLSLDILQDYDPNTRDEETEMKFRMKKKDRVHLSKKERKVRKEIKEIDEEMRKAELVVSAEEREKNQAEILKLVLALYLNILKAGHTNLVGAVLEGLSKFGNMANFDLLGDFLEVMKEIILDTDLTELAPSEVRKVLLCIVSSFSLVSNNRHMKISVDLSTFVNALYAILFNVALDADIELSYKSLRLADPLNMELVKPSVNVSTKAELLLKALNYIFFRTNSGTRERAAAFTKRLYVAIMHTPEKTTVAVLKFIDKLMTKYPDIGGLYSTEDRIGNGSYNVNTDIISRCNSGAATLWENSLLSKHYCPAVTKGISSLANKSKESNK
ncbi:similar to Saccharomyces cerevisiae YLR002C NOC3 Protein that forms a nuclear complex with Noc2p that binds to 66S ribosomal precursors to mediate their intranuclear transport [Maudiozyma barnettii]|uniref:Nucleolar complex-associated protein 3 n=1 Tax=Maudiozyma barnettii TaxID=61262 RepID=A0A8H2ZFM9_9SACH|nr:Noc3p [Kazachstania barnettii]CAB4252520.1 similar to Saccharomyces cerevisiae YLR002C NOC3 Protein that forms a nuclear complex with Noc2p that binds to 66S ribosomal precursors to mediate their intranuclear transport [Kazachstania barnettii]CAD1779254.1 similar to Saccharomyces cerevisiae YLR002C NOC3 Protein that forms a nuclear complex with Noc2p that binds to 66S ribosomal precursors to mediate their intranuclear transport [Kazachstania barnettii]